jgi:type VI secretion system secreted protein Hcp
VDGFSHEIVSPRDPASGLPTGKRQHKPFAIVTPVGAATPLLMNALVTNENLTSVVISFFKPGTTTVGTIVKLTNASVADFSHSCMATYASCEIVAFTYQKIEWTWVDGGTTSSDDWEPPNA